MPGNPLSDPHWAAQIADTVERVVGTVRDKGTTRIIVAARAVVYGIIGVIGGTLAFVLLLILLSRGLQELLALGVDRATAVWLSYLILGGIFCLAGAFVMTKRTVKD